MSPQLRAQAAHVLLDSIGVILAGSLGSTPSRLAEEVQDSRGSSTIFRQGAPKAMPSDAALANGAAGTALELDEGHRPTGHPAIYTLPAVLAASEAVDATGSAVLEALVAGYEAGARLAGAAKLRPEVHVHGAVAAVAAGVGLARLEGAEPTLISSTIKAAACLSLATPFAAGLQGALLRDGFAAAAAGTGQTAWRLARSGYEPPSDALEVVYGEILGTHLESVVLEPADSDEFGITTNYFKRHACCRYLHPTLDAVEIALARHQPAGEQVRRVTVACEDRATTCDELVPANPLAAKFSLPFSVATSIVNGSTGVAAFGEAAVHDPATLRVAQLVSMSAIPEDGDHDRHPPSFRARVSVELTSGETLTGAVERARGDLPDQFDHGFVRSKFADLVSPIVGTAAVPEIQDSILAIAEAPSVHASLEPLIRALSVS